MWTKFLIIAIIAIIGIMYIVVDIIYIQTTGEPIYDFIGSLIPD